MTWDFILRIFVAALLGGAIGLEREYRAKEAGFRTHFLVALGSALFMIRGCSRIARTPLGCIACGGPGRIRYRFHRCRHHHLPEERECHPWSHHRCRSLGHRRHRSGLRRRYVHPCSLFDRPCPCRPRSLQDYPKEVRQEARQVGQAITKKPSQTEGLSIS